MEKFSFKDVKRRLAFNNQTERPYGIFYFFELKITEFLFNLEVQQ